MFLSLSSIETFTLFKLPYKIRGANNITLIDFWIKIIGFICDENLKSVWFGFCELISFNLMVFFSL